MKILLIFGMIPLIIMIFITLINVHNWGLYRKIYKELPSKKFYLNFDQIYSHKIFIEKNDGFVWYTKDKIIKLKPDVYLNSCFYYKFDLYHWYWLCKYNRWLKKNAIPNLIKNY